MALQTRTNLSFVNRIEHCAASRPEEDGTSPAQEMFNGAIPLRNERPAAELLAESLADTDPAGAFALFVP